MLKSKYRGKLMNLLLLVFILFVGVVFLFKVLFLLLGLIFTSAGFIIKAALLLIVTVPLIPLGLVFAGALFSPTGLLVLIACGFIISIIGENEKRYERRYS